MESITTSTPLTPEELRTFIAAEVVRQTTLETFGHSAQEQTPALQLVETNSYPAAS